MKRSQRATAASCPSPACPYCRTSASFGASLLPGPALAHACQKLICFDSVFPGSRHPHGQPRRERERERERERVGEKERERRGGGGGGRSQTDRQTGTGKDRERDTDGKTKAETEKETETDAETKRETEAQKFRDRLRQTQRDNDRNKERQRFIVFRVFNNKNLCSGGEQQCALKIQPPPLPPPPQSTLDSEACPSSSSFFIPSFLFLFASFTIPSSPLPPSFLLSLMPCIIKNALILLGKKEDGGKFPRTHT